MNWQNNSPQIIAALVVFLIASSLGMAFYLNNIDKSTDAKITSSLGNTPEGLFKCNCNSKDIFTSFWSKFELKNGIIKTDLMAYKYEIKDSYIFFIDGKFGGSSFFKIKDDRTIEGVGVLSGCQWIRKK